MEGRAAVTVTIWQLEVSDARLEALRSVLSRDERARADGMPIASVAREFIVGRAIAREQLARAIGCEPHAVVLKADARGKPHLKHPSIPLALSISHSGGYCALALGAVNRLGVDIEAIRPTIGDLAKSVLTPREAAQFEAIDESARMRAFFRSWVAKEAYLKATGEGLAGGLKSFEVSPTTRPEIGPIAIQGDAAVLSKWSFRGFDVTDEIVGAVAIEIGEWVLELGIHFIDAEPGNR